MKGANSVWIGLGFQQGASRRLLEAAIQQALQSVELAATAVMGLATLDRKAQDADLLDLCHDRGWSLQSFTAEQLQNVVVPSASNRVASATGTPSVAEAAALLACQSLASQLLLPKQVFRSSDQPGAVTVAIALVLTPGDLP
ncbi:hypothetical protein BST81_12230 [Leptolyngbya sp. 'hensonii']|uniref:cobalamin biosynthesis protein n=1 Tax=Leptolyngbya sp. 'hensonii' TaxID=1922337 RepID=UPI00094FD7A8|nr:cobalamin biosynthesis protein [Leptolyngbya sp. 'hensonii']OLP17827.1 hypothetical protein BST81_12230 [Leptolyngbya sp. 'hensonii']